jgi:predicted histone-like DNA-binding protein
MAIYYSMKGMNDNIHSEEDKKNGLYPRVVSKRTVFLDELIENATYRTSLSKEETRMGLSLVLTQMINELKEGNSVCFDDFGLFSLSAGSRVVQNEKEIRSYSIGVKRLVFRMSSAFLKKLGVVDFERTPPSFYKYKKK